MTELTFYDTLMLSRRERARSSELPSATCYPRNWTRNRTQMPPDPKMEALTLS